MLLWIKVTVQNRRAAQLLKSLLDADIDTVLKGKKASDTHGGTHQPTLCLFCLFINSAKKGDITFACTAS